MSNLRIVFGTALLFCSAAPAPLEESAMDGGPGIDVDAPYNDGGTMYMALTEGSTDLVTEQIIKYHDNGSTDDQLCFRLHKLPDFGHLYQDETDPFHKNLLKTGDVFCQKDIHDHHITYSAPDPNEAKPMPKFVFLVFDAFDASNNTLSNQMVTMEIATVNQM